MKWPAQSPDLNPIEKKHKGPFKIADEQYKAIEDTWSENTHDKIDKLIESMPKRYCMIM